MRKLELSKIFGEEMIKLAAKYKKLVVMDADVAASSRVPVFARNFQDRYLHFGLSEESMIASAAAFASRGFLPFACSDALYLTGQAYAQIRNMLAFPNFNVKLVGFDAGIALGEEGPMMHSLEDIALMRVIPNMKIYSPADAGELRACLNKMCEEFGPAYLRLSSGLAHDVNRDGQDSCDATVLRDGKDVCVLSTGTLLNNVMAAAEKLEAEGVSVKVINIALLKPLNEAKILEFIVGMKSIVVVEDHFQYGGLGSIISELLVQKYPARLHHLAVDDFMGSASGEELYRAVGLDVEGLCKYIMHLDLSD